MTTLISRLPSLRLNSTGDPLNVHQRIESAPPSPYVEEADLGTFNDGEPEEDQVVDPDTQMNKRKKKKKKWKGKGREDDVEGDMGKLARERSDERLVQHHHRRSDSSGGPAYEDVSTGQAEFGGSSAYPPMNDEDMETRRIEEVCSHSRRPPQR
ncbi:hypothetical protein FRC03_012292 [Tulasnella sp. 419]|nr:hypothetical protein FRC03_012292 [Tulasnella sp. 419]